MRFSVLPGSTDPWNDTLELTNHLEATGWDGVWVPDHFMPNEDPTGPRNEAWTTLAALAASVQRIRLGVLVTGNTYRHPAVLAKMAATVDIISGGRMVLGIGGGWQENEHEAYGIPFYTVGERLRRLEEACQVIRGLFRNEKTTFRGKYYRLTEAPLSPKSVQRPWPPLMIGGGGERVTLRIVACYADEWNVPGPPDLFSQKSLVLDQHCAQVGRDPSEIMRSGFATFLVTSDPADAERLDQNSTRPPLIAGSPDRLKKVVRQYIDAGADELVLAPINLGDADSKREQYDRFMREVVPAFR